jgi:large subunit ribosomal protein L23
MDLTRVIIGSVVTEKAERQKAAERHTYTLRVQPRANKVDIARALETYFGVDVASVRVMKVQPKTRMFGEGSTMEKRHSYKKALVTLTKDSKVLDLSSFQAQA